jgi:hypothetical protein
VRVQWCAAFRKDDEMNELVSVQEMAEHITRLAQVHGVTVTSHSTGGRAWRKTRRIAVRPVKSDKTYAIALHELGHVLGRTGPRRLDKEVFAWDWAYQHALIWTDTMDAERARCLQSYVVWAQRKQARTGKVYLAPGHRAVSYAARAK